MCTKAKHSCYLYICGNRQQSSRSLKSVIALTSNLQYISDPKKILVDYFHGYEKFYFASWMIMILILYVWGMRVKFNFKHERTYDKCML